MKVKLIAITLYRPDLVEEAGRRSYRFDSRATRRSAKQFLRRLLESGDQSILNHVYAKFRITGISEMFTRQFVRRGLRALSRQSQCYVNDRSFSCVEPPSIQAKPETHGVFRRFLCDTRKTYARLQKLGVPNEDARFVLPNAVRGEIVLSASFSQLCRIFCQACDSHTPWEIRYAAVRMFRIMKTFAPAAFSDFVIDERTGSICEAIPF